MWLSDFVRQRLTIENAFHANIYTIEKLTKLYWLFLKFEIRSISWSSIKLDLSQYPFLSGINPFKSYAIFCFVKISDRLKALIFSLDFHVYILM